MLKIFFSIEIEKSETPLLNYKKGDLEQLLKIKECIEKTKAQVAIRRDKYLTLIYKTAIFILVAIEILSQRGCFLPIRSSNHLYYINFHSKCP